MISRGRAWFLVSLLVMVMVSGCARNKDLERVNRQQAATIVSLNDELAKLNEQLEALRKAKGDLNKTRKDLENKLKSELSEGDVSLSMQARGLVLTVLDRILFDSGKASVKETAGQTLDKVASILNKDTKTNLIYVEGHTDNEPIRHSGWKSNWELSTARATEVIHYMIDSGSIDPNRLVASGYGEFHPVTLNDSEENKQKNRRVEIIISPHKITDQKLTSSPSDVSKKATGGEEVIK